jgi:hypothetical protein
MNPSFPIDEYERAKRTLPTWKFEMFYNGNFSRPAGMIYEDFTESHIIPPFDLPANFARYFGVDFGAVHTAKIWLAQDPATKVNYLYREALDGNLTTAEQVQSVKRHNEYNLLGWGGAKSEGQQRRDWGAAGLQIKEPPVWEVESGINRVIALLKEKRLYIFSNCIGIIDEFGTYSRELDVNGQATERIKDKATYHRLDALRYVVSGLGVPTKQVRTWRG